MVCLTFDTDWMTEESLSRFLEAFPLPGAATFFCHRPFACLEASAHERCPHPFLSDLDAWQAPLAALREDVNPAARGVRAHSCVFSHMIGIGLRELGFEYVSQANNLYHTGLFPFRHPWGVWELPIYYMDNMDFWTSENWPDLKHVPFSRDWIQTAIAGDDLYVFDFHPIHIALNTRTAADYQLVKREIITAGASPFELAVAGRGTREYFLELCAAMTSANVASLTCSEALDAWATRVSVVANRA